MIGATNTQVVFGTSPTTRKTLTASYVADTNSYVLYRYCKEANIEIFFTTGTATGEFCDVLVETSNDGLDATPTNWTIWSPILTPDSTPTTKYNTYGVGIEVPSDAITPAAGTSYKRSITINPEGANWLRFSVKSSASANFGSATVKVTVSENA